MASTALQMYDIIVRARRYTDIFDLNWGWPVEQQRSVNSSSPLSGPTPLRVALLGEASVGKTWLLRELQGLSPLPEFESPLLALAAVNVTHRSSARPVWFLDTLGHNRVPSMEAFLDVVRQETDVAPDASGSDLNWIVNRVHKSADEDAARLEMIVRDVACDFADVLLLVVRDLTASARHEIKELHATAGRIQKRLIVVHNCKFGESRASTAEYVALLSTLLGGIGNQHEEGYFDIAGSRHFVFQGGDLNSTRTLNSGSLSALRRCILETPKSPEVTAPAVDVVASLLTAHLRIAPSPNAVNLKVTLQEDRFIIPDVHLGSTYVTVHDVSLIKANNMPSEALLSPLWDKQVETVDWGSLQRVNGRWWMRDEVNPFTYVTRSPGVWKRKDPPNFVPVWINLVHVVLPELVDEAEQLQHIRRQLRWDVGLTMGSRFLHEPPTLKVHFVAKVERFPQKVLAAAEDVNLPVAVGDVQREVEVCFHTGLANVIPEAEPHVCYAERKLVLVVISPDPTRPLSSSGAPALMMFDDADSTP